eukprot:TRINITY_DN27801_c0_g1_i1.p1 TRINITY_DN27801_c0_g1~~TRINITY_DN27801_c0_g1_i1.p1  ORF type:complete len:144 (+),score=17.53 TRINITY_DN27801_c0_g1_i1:151-582(+)
MCIRDRDQCDRYTLGAGCKHWYACFKYRQWVKRTGKSKYSVPEHMINMSPQPPSPQSAEYQLHSWTRYRVNGLNLVDRVKLPVRVLSAPRTKQPFEIPPVLAHDSLHEGAWEGELTVDRRERLRRERAARRSIPSSRWAIRSN